MALQQKQANQTEIAIIGAGIAGIATAFYLCTEHKKRDVVLVDSRQPMSFTSAQSGENYRNWWPHPTMTQFTNQSIGLMERIALQTDNRLRMTRRGYLLATREKNIDTLVAELFKGYGQNAQSLVRIHDNNTDRSYRPAKLVDWKSAPDGVDVIRGRERIQQFFPWFSNDVASVVHIRRAGEISAQQMGQYMLEGIRTSGGRLRKARVKHIQLNKGFALELDGPDGSERMLAEYCVNAAGPLVKEVAAMIGVDLPVSNILQQKIAFEDRAGAVPRQMPFSVDLDERTLDWAPEDRELLAGDETTARLVQTLPAGLHCRPDGAEQGTWVKVGWAWNDIATEPVWEPSLDDCFPEIALRRAAAFIPALQIYDGSVPPNYAHYGGYYTLTDENWPIIGPMGVAGAYIVGALSGFGTMAACAAGRICAAWIANGPMPDYAGQLSMARYADAELMKELREQTSKGIL